MQSVWRMLTRKANAQCGYNKRRLMRVALTACMSWYTQKIKPIGIYTA